MSDRILKLPRDYAKMVLDCMYGDYKAAMVELFGFAASDPTVPATYWAEVASEMLHLSQRKAA